LRNLNRKEGLAILMVTHDEEIAKTADRVVHMRDGEVES